MGSDNTFTLQTMFGKYPKMPLLDGDTAQFFSGKVISVVGGAGSIGSSLVKSLLESTQARVVILDNDESRLHSLLVNLSREHQERCKTRVADIRDYYSICAAMEFADANAVIHAAALKHVSVLEEQPREAFLTNIIGTMNVLKAAQKSQVADFLFVSTDKATDPQGVLGKTKLLGERMTHFSRDSFGEMRGCVSAVRFGNVFLSRGSVLETFIASASRGEALNIHDKNMTRYFMELGDAANIILTVMALRKKKIGILNMGEPIKIMDLAQKVITKLESSSEIRETEVKAGEKIHETLVSKEFGGIVENFDTFTLYDFQKEIDPNYFGTFFPKTDSEALEIIEKAMQK